MITASTFVADYPEFGNPVRYPQSGINYWGALANLMLANPNSTNFWDTTPGGFVPPPLRLTLGSAAGGALAAATYFAAATYVTPQGETTASDVSQLAVATNNLMTATSPQNLPNVKGWNLYVGTVLGSYVLQNTTPMAIGTNWTEPTSGLLTTGNGPPQYNTSGPKALIDVGVELFVAHNLALEVQAQDAANLSAVPGTVAGPIVSRSANGVSVSYDSSSGVEVGAGHWNMTTYGRRLKRLFNIVGAVPIQIGVGIDPTGGMNGPGWSGPPPFIIGSPGSAIY